MMKKLFLFLLTLSALTSSARTIETYKHFGDMDTVAVALAGNAWITQQAAESKAAISKSGLVNWVDPQTVTSVYFKAEYPGSFKLSLRMRASGSSTVKVSLENQSYTTRVSNTSFENVEVGNFKIAKAGYVKVDVQGLEKSAADYGVISHLLLQGVDVSQRISYVKDNEDNRFYWGRRGPSVHLAYAVPEEISNDVEYFYSEINVPEGMDPVGSYFMANGFAQGYFGIQANSLKERRVLFSIWSPFTTDDPSAIPDSLKIKLVKKGKDVYTGEFGNEGSGGQSYLVFPWKAGKNHAFLTRAQPDALKRTTTYTSYFKPAGGQWMLIASFMRPNTTTGLKRLHSFLENFDPNMGNQVRRANYVNQWIRDVKGNWTEITEAKFTGDDIANRAFRKDVAAGVDAEQFYLKNGGFFSDNTPLKTVLKKPASKHQAPVIDFSKLPD